MKTSNLPFPDSVFINCPFDKTYLPLLHSIIFTVYRCGFLPKSALGENNALTNRIDKIVSLIRGCKYGIHDLSRTEINDNNLPRFNMPFEYGIFYGACKLGDKTQRNKVALVLEKEKYSYQKYISDIAGIDTSAHYNKVPILISLVRDWLLSSSGRKDFPSSKKIQQDHHKFLLHLPHALRNAEMKKREMTFNDYCLFVEEFLRNIINK
jgi:hypothetical protein